MGVSRSIGHKSCDRVSSSLFAYHILSIVPSLESHALKGFKEYILFKYLHG